MDKWMDGWMKDFNEKSQEKAFFALKDT